MGTPHDVGRVPTAICHTQATTCDDTAALPNGGNTADGCITFRNWRACVKAPIASSTATLTVRRDDAQPVDENAQLNGDAIFRTRSANVAAGLRKIALKTKNGAHDPSANRFSLAELCAGGLSLIFRFPLFVRHAVDRFATLVLGHGNALRVGGVLHPVGQAVAAEARKVHEVDILHVSATAQMLNEAPQNGGFEFCACSVVEGHAILLFRCET